MVTYGRVRSVTAVVNLPREVRNDMTFSTISTMTDYAIVKIDEVEDQFRHGVHPNKKPNRWQALADQIIALPAGSAMRPNVMLHDKSVSALRSLLAKMGYSLRYRAADKCQYFWAEKRPEGWKGTNNRFPPNS